MFYVYILKSKLDNKLYIGYTTNLRKRIKEHNEKKNRATKYRGKLELIYYEAYKAEDDAKKREHNLKYFGKAHGQLKGRIAKSLEI